MPQAPRRRGAVIVFAALAGPAVLAAIATASLRSDLAFGSRMSKLCWAGGLAAAVSGGAAAGAAWLLSGRHLGDRPFARRLTRVLSVAGSTLLLAFPGLGLVTIGPIVAAMLVDPDSDSQQCAPPAACKTDASRDRDRVLQSPPLRPPEETGAR
jgi:hypothetical protein